MILQLGSILSSVLGGSPGAGFFSTLGGIATRAISGITPLALGVGEQFATGLINRELNRSSRNDLEDAFKAQLRAAANAVSPTVAPGQGPVFSGGPATGSAFAPATLLPPSISPPGRILQTDPNFFGGQSGQSFQTTRRPPDLFITDEELRRFPVQQAGVGGLVSAGSQVLRFLKSLGPSGSRRMAGLTATAVGVEAATGVGAQFLFPSTALAPGVTGARLEGFTAFPTGGDPLRLTEATVRRESAMPVAPMPTGLPRTGNFQREANGCFVQWFFWDGNMGTQPQPIERGQAACLKRDCIFRLNVFTGKFVKLKGRRMNPMNVTAFFRAGRRVDSGERICRKMFSEHRKTKTGTIRRKRSRKAKR